MPGPRETAVVAERDASCGTLRTVPYYVRGHSGWLDTDPRYAVLLTPAWRTA